MRQRYIKPESETVNIRLFNSILENGGFNNQKSLGASGENTPTKENILEDGGDTNEGGVTNFHSPWEE